MEGIARWCGGDSEVVWRGYRGGVEGVSRWCGGIEVVWGIGRWCGGG